MTHPIETVILNGASPAKSDFREFVKVRQALVLETAAEVTSMTLAGTLALVLGNVVFAADEADGTTPHDGVQTLVSSDGVRFKAPDTTRPLTNYQISVPLTGATVTATEQDLRIYPAGTLANLTIALRTPVGDGDVQEIYFAKAITALAFSGGSIFDAAPTTAAAGFRLKLRYWNAASVWLLG